MATKRIQNERKQWTENRAFEMHWQDEHNPFEALLVLRPDSGPYAGLLFRLKVAFRTDYPFKSPRFCFETPIVHPMVHGLEWCCADFRPLADWSPRLTVHDLAGAMIEAMREPWISYADDIKRYLTHPPPSLWRPPAIGGKAIHVLVRTLRGETKPFVAHALWTGRDLQQAVADFLNISQPDSSLHVQREEFLLISNGKFLDQARTLEEMGLKDDARLNVGPVKLRCGDGRLRSYFLFYNVRRAVTTWMWIHGLLRREFPSFNKDLALKIGNMILDDRFAPVWFQSQLVERSKEAFAKLVRLETTKEG